MGEILNLSRWKRFEYETREGQTVAFEVKRLNALEAAPFLAAMAVASGQIAECYAEIQRLTEALPADQIAPAGEPIEPKDSAPDVAKAYEAEYEAWGKAHPEYLQGLRAQTLAVQKLDSRSRELRAKVSELIPLDLVERAFGKYVRNVEGLELDGVRATTGPDLLEIADQRMLLDVLGHVREMSEISGPKVKASGSPSTSSLVAVTSDSGSVATHTGGEDGPQP